MHCSVPGRRTANCAVLSFGSWLLKQETVWWPGGEKGSLTTAKICFWEQDLVHIWSALPSFTVWSWGFSASILTRQETIWWVLPVYKLSPSVVRTTSLEPSHWYPKCDNSWKLPKFPFNPPLCVSRPGCSEGHFGSWSAGVCFLLIFPNYFPPFPSCTMSWCSRTCSTCPVPFMSL